MNQEISDRWGLGKWLFIGAVVTAGLLAAFSFCFVTGTAVNSQKQAIDQKQVIEEEVRESVKMQRSDDVNKIDRVPEHLRGLFK